MPKKMTHEELRPIVKVFDRLFAEEGEEAAEHFAAVECGLPYPRLLQWYADEKVHQRDEGERIANLYLYGVGT